jgi:hypothetical protein
MIESTAGGSLNTLAMPQCLNLFAVKAYNDE